MVSHVPSGDPLATLLVDSLDHDRAGAPVDRELLVFGAGASVLALICAAIGRFWALDMGPGGWVGASVVEWGQVWSFRLATPTGAFAFGALALDCVLASGVRVGEWARWACVMQIIGAAAAIPLLVALAVVVLNIAAVIALVVVGCVIAIVIVGALAEAS